VSGGSASVELDVTAAAGLIRSRIDGDPSLLLVLGSGLGALADAVEESVTVSFDEIPGLPGSGVAGHAGRWIAGRLEGRRVLVQSGRFHHYEGHGTDIVAAPVRIAARLGVRAVILTNAAGGIGRGLDPGTIMVIEDHVNLLWRSPLAGPVAHGEQRFPDMSAPYDPELQDVAVRAATDLGVPVQRGTYAAMLGPSYETPAEIRMLDRLGIHAVGMSTVPEVIVARALGLKVLAFSLITNRAAGLGHGSLGHDEVMEVGARAAGSLEAVIRRVLNRIPG
jgi:purine-nucleoside phosphorylase